MPGAGRTSFVFNGGGTWTWYEENGQQVPLEEIKQHVRAVVAHEGAVAGADLRALIIRKLRAAEAGRLQPPDDVKTYLTIEPGVMELRWRVGRSHWRLYYCEPPRLISSRGMLGLLFNRKDSPEQQNADITEAATRWRAWQAAQRG